MDLTNKQWDLVKKIVSSQKKNESKRGRPALDKREVMNAILWVLSKGARWKQIPDCYPQYQTCRNYFYEWLKTGAMEGTLRALISDLDEEIDEEDGEIEQLASYFEENMPLSKRDYSQIVKKLDTKLHNYSSPATTPPINSVTTGALAANYL
jgi:hypothetical protein